MARRKSKKSKDAKYQMLVKPNTKPRTPTSPLGDLHDSPGELRNRIYRYIDSSPMLKIALPGIDYSNPSTSRIRYLFFTDPETRRYYKNARNLLRLSNALREEYGSFILRADQTFYQKVKLDRYVITMPPPFPISAHINRLYIRATMDTFGYSEAVLEQLNRVLDAAPSVSRLSMHICITSLQWPDQNMYEKMYIFRAATVDRMPNLLEYAIMLEGNQLNGVWYKRDSTADPWPKQPLFKNWDLTSMIMPPHTPRTTDGSYYERKRFRGGLQEDLAATWAVAEYHPRTMSVNKRREYDKILEELQSLLISSGQEFTVGGAGVWKAKELHEFRKAHYDWVS
ncbi:hypothetical protein CLAFUW4_10742 [Fulvia fulva]|uniref:Uncharacterized protein n=1 Tax=Passalora fulva TaxID=5499 RepID=A0A9Q8P7H1_PASFU|nr:uncharacterized protein CLAFUR5_05355 [Fulvia fulva]KAK4615953.1 hypothetical protein CLAFUR4_10747 [Fulvia fulva]KAK4616520.1 hypothetical protein CLAFUR0_10754 [Fulvia fulva]UJO16048.1 hypothetical protein CLAFUR5_05355 [Fulvia fulva]WPV19738.1 hypothetical protein CLAFUW4_10742 [Fulvia fulva]WPV33701.1 hypothetical protein CLAFUW7_10744 [Fulvia fulva]